MKFAKASTFSPADFKNESIGKRCLYWIIFSDIYITLGSTSFAFVNASLLGIPILQFVPLLILIASATMFIYQFSRWTFFQRLIAEQSKDRLYYWMEDHKFLVKFLMFASVIVGMVSVFYIKRETLFTLIVLGMISFLYNLKIPLSGEKGWSLRKVPFVKIFTIAFVWASMSVLLPWIEMFGCSFEWEMLNLWCLQFLFILVITLPFDINDITVDEKEGVKTIPIALGIGKTKRLLSILTYTYIGFLLLWFWNFQEINIVSLIFLAGIIILMLALLYKTQNRSFRAEKWQIMLWYDGSLIIYSIVYLVSIFLNMIL